MTDFESSIDNFYKALVLQYGYLTIFAIYYPIVTLYAFIANIFHIILLATSYNFYTRRPLSQPIKGIGAYKKSFNFITIVAIIYNAFVLIYPTNGVKHYFDDDDVSRDYLVILVVLAFIFAAKIALENQIPEISFWLSQQIERYHNRNGAVQLPSFAIADSLVQIFDSNIGFGREAFYDDNEYVYVYKDYWMKSDYSMDGKNVDFEICELAKV